MMKNNVLCAVCGAALPPLAARMAAAERWPVCVQVSCRMVQARRAAMGDVQFKPYIERQARLLKDQAAKNALLQQRAQQEEAENSLGFAALQASVPAGVQTRQMVLPSGPHRRIKLSRLRRKRYRLHLTQVIEKAFAARLLPDQEPPEQDSLAMPADLPADAPAAADAPASAAPSHLPGHLCAACGGGCCTLGGDHAYVSAKTIRRFLTLAPQLQPHEVLAAYMGRLAARTQAGSCINHTDKGCSLSREMRSDICNVYACDELKAVEHDVASGPGWQTILVVRRQLDNWSRKDTGRDNRIVALAVVSEAGISVLPG